MMGKEKKALADLKESCDGGYQYACSYNTKDTVGALDLNKGLVELPGEEADQVVEEAVAVEEAVVEEDEDQTMWIPSTALAGDGSAVAKKGAAVTVGDMATLRTAWETYDEWSEDYAWQTGMSGTIVDLDAEDGTIQLYYGEAEAEVVEDEKPATVTFETAPIKHIKDKTLKAFQNKFKKVAMFFYR